MNTLFKIEHIYGQEICSISNIDELQRRVKIRFDSNIQQIFYENNGKIEVDDVQLRIDNIRVRVDGQNLIITLHVDG
jgi:hypothetical protein